MASELPELKAFLGRVGIEDHPHGRVSLIDHLLGTAALLNAWGLHADVVVAGLVHSVYGTEFYKHQSVSPRDRDRVRAVVGERAEQLAFTFCHMSRDSLYRIFLDASGSNLLARRDGEEPMTVADRDITDLAHIALANWLEQLPRARGENAQNSRRSEFLAMRGQLVSGAQEAIDRVFGDSHV